MKTAILVDQPGTFVVLSTLGLVATMYSKGEPNSIQIFKNNVFPPFLWCVLNFDFHEWIQYILQKVGSGVTPLRWFQWVTAAFESRSQHWQFWDWASIKLILTSIIYVCML
jgi:hypothetical protein